MIKFKINKSAARAFNKKVEGIRTAFGERQAAALGDEVLKEMKDMISKGISPIEGNGRFPAYKHQGVKGRYPDSVKYKYPSKRDRPVNLDLSGRMLKGLIRQTSRGKYGYGVVVGYFSRSESVKEQGHREGVNGQPSRPTIPARGEAFAIRIQRIVFKHFREAIRGYIKAQR